jgi:hypothetical protein
MIPMEMLDIAKKNWDASHSAGGEYVNDAGKKYLFIRNHSPTHPEWN